MKIMVKRQYLLDQLPDGDIPEELILDGIPVTTPSEDEEIETKHPDVFTVLSGVQWAFFVELAKKDCAGFELRKFLRYGPGNGTNGVCVHVYQINKKLSAAGIPFKIVAVKRGNSRLGIMPIYRLSST